MIINIKILFLLIQMNAFYLLTLFSKTWVSYLYTWVRSAWIWQTYRYGVEQLVSAKRKSYRWWARVQAVEPLSFGSKKVQIELDSTFIFSSDSPFTVCSNFPSEEYLLNPTQNSSVNSKIGNLWINHCIQRSKLIHMMINGS